MKVSVNWIRQFNNLNKTSADPMPDGIDNLVEKIGAQLGAVDEVIETGEKYKDITIVKVVSCIKHPNADKLSICLVDDGRAVKDVERNQDNLVQVVCGAPNVKSGMLAVWIPPGATVPSTHDKKPFVIEARKIRDEISNGMLASAKELALGDNHEGILEIDENIKPGALFSSVYKLDDYIIDIENKMFTHRPDLFGQMGIGREIAGIHGHGYKSPDWYKVEAPLPSSNSVDNLILKVKNEIPKLVPRFALLTIKDIKVGTSPVWLQTCLARVGVRSINNIVDLTNYYMLLTAQPLHAYDYDKVKSGIVGVRLSKKGEHLKLLGGKDINLQEGTIVITDGSDPIGLGGVMGGAGTEVDEGTKNIILECATFDMNVTRRSAMAHGLFTDAATRFTKGQSPLQNRAVIAKAATDVLRLAGGKVSSKLIDDNHLAEDALKRGSLYPPVNITSEFINSRLGLKMAPSGIKKILENVEFAVKVKGNNLQITAPFWRTDIEIPEDVVEEVGRLHGYDKLPIALPQRDLSPAEVDSALRFKSRLREILVGAGANEALTYNFVHADLLKKVGQNSSMAYKISNAISPDLHYYRLSITPSLLDKIHPNVKLGFREFALFEINKSHNRNHRDEIESRLPKEFNELAFVFVSSYKKAKDHGAPYYQAKKYLEYLAKQLGINFDYIPMEDKNFSFFVTRPFDLSRIAKIIDRDSGVPIGFVGEYRQEVLQKFKLPNYSAGFELDINILQSTVKSHQVYTAINRFPPLEQDFNLRTDVQITYSELSKFMTEELELVVKEHGYNYQILPLDIFQKENDKKHKQTTWRITLSHPDRTLTTAETNILLDKIAQAAKSKLNAERI